MKKIYLLVLSVLIFQLTNGQNPVSKLNNGGALLVRLQTNQHLIQYHLDKLELDQAKLIEKNQKIKNQKIIENFQENWSLCPIYFFYSNDINEIQNNNFKKVFKNKPSIILNDVEKSQLKDNFLFAYFGDYPGYLNFDALVLINQNLEPLKKPIPRYVRTYKGLWIFERKINKTIRRLQKKIEFYASRIK
ncbi:MAG: hypothetical protein CMD26_01940 [Flavobacteriales bacterium]|nr:hypothetical protein [Flavobacteriales bacterium]|tara:strand:- start:4136 stop:4705 length:570 start_codon:yes stop_codon:yes gene_type:complete